MVIRRSADRKIRWFCLWALLPPVRERLEPRYSPRKSDTKVADRHPEVRASYRRRRFRRLLPGRTAWTRFPLPRCPASTLATRGPGRRRCREHLEWRFLLRADERCSGTPCNSTTGSNSTRRRLLWRPRYCIVLFELNLLYLCRWVLPCCYSVLG